MKTLLIDVWKRLTPWNKQADIYANDSDNAYPERMDRLINNSVTAKSAANTMVQYLIGKGYGVENDNIIINKERNLKLIDFADDVADDLDRKSTRLNSSHGYISYAVFCLKKKKK